MGFNKRFIDMEILSVFYTRDKEEGIGNCIGKADVFICDDSQSSKVIDLWIDNKKEEARKIMENYVLRITF